MNRFSILLITAAFMSIGISSNALSGHETGNGSDYFHMGDGSAWFLGADRVIRYCLDLSPNFGVDEAKASAAVRTALGRWDNYIAQKRIYARSPRAAMLTTKSQQLAKCDGSEDLKFSLGAQASDDLGPGGSEDPQRIASAVRVSYNTSENWGKGYIWMAARGSIHNGEVEPSYPDWTRGQNLEGILMHELGHMYGSEHINSTIMRKDIGNFLNGAGQADPVVLSSIDNEEEMVTCFSCEGPYRASLGWQAQVSGLGTEAETFAVLVGRLPTGAVSAVIRGTETKGLQLVVGDGLQEYSFPLKFDIERRAQYYDSTEAFRTIFTYQLSPQTTAIKIDFLPHGGSTLPGTLVTNSGLSLQLYLLRNMTTLGVTKPLTVTYVKDGKSHVLLTIDAEAIDK
jgi:hypothetical protein